MSDTGTVVFRKLGIPDEPFTEYEISSIVAELFNVLDKVSPRRSASASKTALIDFFGIAKTGKTKTTENVDRVFRRAGCNVLCPPETAEIPEIRNRSTAEILVFQARHVTGVQDYVLNLAENRDYHVAIISRGLIDMLYWYARWVKEGKCEEIHRQRIREAAYELLRLDLVDAYFFFTCAPEEAMRREYEGSPTKKEGSNMNLNKLHEAIEIYAEVLAHVRENIPGLPLFTIDTTHLTLGATTAEVLRYLLPTLCARFHTTSSNIIVKSPSLLKKEAVRARYFEEQLKLRGHPSQKRLIIANWTKWEKFGEVEQEDFYLDINPLDGISHSPSEENVRIRKQGDSWFIYFKSSAKDSVFSRRYPLLVPITQKEATEMLEQYKTVLRVKKHRMHFIHNSTPKFVLHLDTVEGAGNFTEIRVIGEQSSTHTAALLSLATVLGFGLSDIVEGNYVSILKPQI